MEPRNAFAWKKHNERIAIDGGSREQRKKSSLPGQSFELIVRFRYDFLRGGWSISAARGYTLAAPNNMWTERSWWDRRDYYAPPGGGHRAATFGMGEVERKGLGRGIEIKAGRNRDHEGNERVKQRFRSSKEDRGLWGGGRVRDLRVKEADRRVYRDPREDNWVITAIVDHLGGLRNDHNRFWKSHSYLPTILRLFSDKGLSCACTPRDASVRDQDYNRKPPANGRRMATV